MLTGGKGVYPLPTPGNLLQNHGLFLIALRVRRWFQFTSFIKIRAMADISLDLTSSIFAKTPIGQQEIQSRALGLPPLVRRLLVLIDGKRSSKELADYVPGQDIAALLQHLIDHGCIDAPQPAAARQRGLVASATVATPPSAMHPDLARLPGAEQRTGKEIEMARNFMTNTINTIIGQNVRFTLIKSIHACASAADLRRIYPDWVAAMSDNRIGLKRLPELRDKLFQVL